jgi:SAM-dependent methyltransferase
MVPAYRPSVCASYFVHKTALHAAAAFGTVLDGILVLSRPKPSDVCVDLGAGSGFVTTALAPLVASVHAVDISPAMTEALAERAANAGLANVSTAVTDLKDFRLPPSYADLIVSSYALHHLADADKRALTARAAQWLCPGGRLVIADMMFGRGGSCRDRAILRQKVAALAAKGIRRMVAHREEPDPLRPPRRAGAPGNAGVLAAGAARCGTSRGVLPAGRRRSRHRLRRPPAIGPGRPVSPGCAHTARVNQPPRLSWRQQGRMPALPWAGPAPGSRHLSRGSAWNRPGSAASLGWSHFRGYWRE